MKKFFVSISIMVLLAGFAVAQNGRLKKKYTSRKHKFSICYPEDWEKRENISVYVPVLFMEPVEEANDTFRENVNVVIENLNGYTLEQYYEGNLKALKNGLEAFKYVESGNTIVNNQDSKWLIYEHTYLGTSVKVLVYFFSFKDKGFVITSSASPDSFESHENIFKMITESFKRK